MTVSEAIQSMTAHEGPIMCAGRIVANYRPKQESPALLCIDCAKLHGVHRFWKKHDGTERVCFECGNKRPVELYVIEPHCPECGADWVNNHCANNCSQRGI